MAKKNFKKRIVIKNSKMTVKSEINELGSEANHSKESNIKMNR